MNIVDSSGWLEYFAGGPNSVHFSLPLRETSSLIVPVITIYEVFKVVLREAGEDEALQSIAAMQKGKIVDLTISLSMSAPNSACNTICRWPTASYSPPLKSINAPSGPKTLTLKICRV